jgi:hypothetical protein
VETKQEIRIKKKVIFDQREVGGMKLIKAIRPNQKKMEK